MAAAISSLQSKVSDVERAQPFRIGSIAKPISRNTGVLTVSPSDPYVRIAQTGIAVAGMTVEKIGQKTGWTSGGVTQTCVTAMIIRQDWVFRRDGLRVPTRARSCMPTLIAALDLPLTLTTELESILRRAGLVRQGTGTHRGDSADALAPSRGLR